MKRLLFLCLILFSINLGGQSSESLSEKFANQTGVLISKEYVEMGFLDQIDIRYVKMKNLFSNETQAGLRLEYMPGNEIINNPKIAYIDNDEIDAIIKALKLLQTSVINKRFPYQSDFTVHCRSGLTLGYFYDASKTKWQPFIQITPKDPQSTIRLANDDFSFLLKVLLDTKNIK